MKRLVLRRGVCTCLLISLLFLVGCAGPGNLFAGSSSGANATQGHLLYVVSGGTLTAFQSLTGTKVWSVNTSNPSISYQSFLVDHSVVYAASDTLSALDAQSGKVLWQAAIGADGNALAPISSIVADHAHVYIVVNGVAYALNARDGSMLWRHVLQLQTTLNPPLVPPDTLLAENGILYSLASGGGQAYALHEQDGSQVWDTVLPDPGLAGDTFPGENLSLDDLAFSNGLLYGKAYNAVVALDPTSGKQRWLKPFGQVHSWTLFNGVPYVDATDDAAQAGAIGAPIPSKIYALTPSDGTVQWQSTQDFLPPPANLFVQSELSRTLSQKGTIYELGGPSFGDITALSASTSAVLWQTQSAESYDWVQVEGNSLYAVQPDGTIACLNGQNGTLAWRKKIDETSSLDLIADGTQVYMVDNGANITAINAHTGTVLWHTSVGSDLLEDIPALTIAN